MNASKTKISRPLQRRAPPQVAYDHLSDRLLNNLAPGDVLNRRQVAAELGISVAPVLEAMTQLEAEGLLQTLPRKGTQVRTVRIEDLRGQLLLREAIECQAARLYCGSPVATHTTDLLALADIVDASQGDSLSRWRSETAFHRALVVLAGYDALTEAFDRVMRAKLFISLKFFLEAHPADERGNHRKLVKILKNENPDDAESSIRVHLRQGKPTGLIGTR
jgi:GntR family transcriptional regulator, rspAB operon transcriptional repressor